MQLLLHMVESFVRNRDPEAIPFGFPQLQRSLLLFLRLVSFYLAIGPSRIFSIYRTSLWIVWHARLQAISRNNQNEFKKYKRRSGSSPNSQTLTSLTFLTPLFFSIRAEHNRNGLGATQMPVTVLVSLRLTFLRFVLVFARALRMPVHKTATQGIQGFMDGPASPTRSSIKHRSTVCNWRVHDQAGNWV